MSLHSTPASRRLCAVLRPAGGYFCPRFQQHARQAKKQNLHKGHLQARHGVLCPCGYPSIFQHRKTAHRSRQRPAQGINQPRPAPRWSKPGYCYLFRARESTAQRSAVWSYQAQRGPWQYTMGRASSAPSLSTRPTHAPDSISGHSRLPSKSSAIVVWPPESRWHSCLIVTDP